MKVRYVSSISLVIQGQTFASEGIEPMLRENIHAQDLYCVNINILSLN